MIETALINALAAYSILSVWRRGEIFGWLRMVVESWADYPAGYSWWVANPISQFFIKASLCDYCFCFHLAIVCSLLNSELCQPWGGVIVVALAVRTVLWWTHRIATVASEITDDVL